MIFFIRKVSKKTRFAIPEEDKVCEKKSKFQKKLKFLKNKTHCMWKRIKDSIESVQNDDWANSHCLHVICEPMIEIIYLLLRNEKISLSHVHKESWQLDGEI